MQMYIWTGPTPDYDGTTDVDVIIHEVTHGTIEPSARQRYGTYQPIWHAVWAKAGAISTVTQCYPNRPIRSTESIRPAVMHTYLGSRRIYEQLLLRHSPFPESGDGFHGRTEQSSA